MDSSTKALANTALSHVFEKLMAEKDSLAGLDRLTTQTMRQDAYGFNQINFNKKDSELLVHYVGIEEEKNLETDPSYAYWSFPAFRFKLSIYYKDSLADNAVRAEIYKIISDNVQALYDHQQTLLPLQLELTSSQAVCKPGEEMQFESGLPKDIGRLMVKLREKG